MFGIHFCLNFIPVRLSLLIPDYSTPLFFTPRLGLIPLHNACSFGHTEVVQLLLAANSDPNAQDNWHYTPLHEAAIKGKVEVCILLLQVSFTLKNIIFTTSRHGLRFSLITDRFAIILAHAKPQIKKRSRM